MYLANKCPGLAAHCYNTLAEFCALTISKLLLVLSYGASAIHSAVSNCVSYYQENERHPRLISAMLKQMIYS